jgi:hypothetical protein
MRIRIVVRNLNPNRSDVHADRPTRLRPDVLSPKTRMRLPEGAQQR